MKRVASDWAEPFRSVVMQLPDDAAAKVIRLEDWPPPLPEDGVSSWNNHGGRASLAGDAAHAMVMCTSTVPFSFLLRPQNSPRNRSSLWGIQ